MKPLNPFFPQSSWKPPCLRIRPLDFHLCPPQDPMDPAKTVIVIRSLVPGGVAEQDGRLLPGDRLMYVNSTDLENASLEEAVQALKGAALGKVQIGVAKPLPVRISSSKTLLLQSFPFKPVGGGGGV